MWKYAVLINILYLMSIVNKVDGQGGRVAPGVPPQHYQQAPPQQQQQYQQPQFQQQQMPQQQMPQQQIPQQQMHQQQMPQVPQQQVPQQHVPQQQVPVQQQYAPQQQAHHHHHGSPQPGQILNAANIVQEKEHIAEHLEVPMDTSKMTDQELQFHYFKMHDADNNNKLDGCELIKSLIHWHEQGSKEHNNPNKVQEKIFKDEELVNLIDPILSMDDTNKDGYIDYPEFVRAQQKAAASSGPPPK